METLVVVWVLCAGLSYVIARDRVPSKSGLATFLGFSFGPLGILFTFFLKEDAANENGGFQKIDTAIQDIEEQPEETEVILREPTLSLEELAAKLEAAKAKT